ncbi:hypothetical protein DFH11DRAFT_462503 [Phellopilus nigrolimitatus]|nr:hypothetical protein DFH11DRAFT_462503 [Phellopilus nigrolimitatus]
MCTSSRPPAHSHALRVRVRVRLFLPLPLAVPVALTCGWLLFPLCPPSPTLSTRFTLFRRAITRLCSRCEITGLTYRRGSRASHSSTPTRRTTGTCTNTPSDVAEEGRKEKSESDAIKKAPYADCKKGEADGSLSLRELQQGLRGCLQLHCHCVRRQELQWTDHDGIADRQR